MTIWALSCLQPGLHAQSDPGPWAKVSHKGLHLGSDGQPFKAEFHVRGQFRYSAPRSGRPRTERHFLSAADPDFEIRRARFKGKGYIAKPWLTFDFEHSLAENRSLDATLTVAKLEWLQVTAGQWNADYHREQMNSSAELEIVERSIVNPVFTLNRQKGVELHGRVGKGRPWDSQYWSGVFLGNGRGFIQAELTDRDHGDGSPLWVNRYQWNAMGGGVDYAQSDLELSSAPRLSLAVATARNRSRYTRFSRKRRRPARRFRTRRGWPICSKPVCVRRGLQVQGSRRAT